jgi:adenylyltransferase/sulfurtransferase
VLSDRDLERFSRQLLLADFSIEQQERLASSRVLVIGCGGLGHPLAAYLAGAGVGGLILADGDRVERSNLARQLLFCEADIGAAKAPVLARYLQERFPDCQVNAVDEFLDAATLRALGREVQVIVDGSDNYPTRFATNRAAIDLRLPLVSAAAVRSEGQLASFHVAAGTACYRCVHPDDSARTALACRDSGVLGPVVGVLGTLQALEVIKVLTGWGEALLGQMLCMDLRTLEQQRIRLRRRPACPDCGQAAGGDDGNAEPGDRRRV